MLGASSEQPAQDSSSYVAPATYPQGNTPAPSPAPAPASAPSIATPTETGATGSTPSGGGVGMPDDTRPDARKLGEISKIDLADTAQASSRFFLGLGIALIGCSLLAIALKTQKASALSQAKDSYQIDVEGQLSNEQFKDQEGQVLNVGKQVALLKSSLQEKVLFSKFLAELEKVTYKKSRYTDISANDTNSVTLSVVVSDFNEMAKALAALRTSTAFKSIILSDVTLNTEASQVEFKVQIELDPTLLGGKAQSSAAETEGDGTTTASPTGEGA